MTESTNTAHVGTAAGHHPGYEARFVAVESEVAGLKSDLGEIKGMVKDIGTTVSAKSQPNLQLITIVVTLALSSVGAIWVLFSVYSSHVEAAIKEQKEQTASVVASLAQFKPSTQINVENGYLQQLAAKDAQLAGKDAAINAAKVDRIATDVDELKKIVVPISTHQELWATQHKTNDALAAQIDENRRALADITAPRDTISRIYKRLDDVESLARGHAGRTD